MQNRISQFLLDENITSAEFADKIGVQRSSVSHVLNGRNYPSATFIQKILKAYTNLNPRWLILGDGDVYESKNAALTGNTLFSKDNFEEKRGNSFSGQANSASNTDTNIGDEESDTISADREPIAHDIINDAYRTNYSKKSIERIVVFYKDKTFKEYKPAE